jgi:16S rRNA C967 or C1407 C5-methylase (RsmB/RsmF family)
MKNKVINAATCDARAVTEDSLAGFDRIDEKTFWPHLDGTDGFYACVLRKKE